MRGFALDSVRDCKGSPFVLGLRDGLPVLGRVEGVPADVVTASVDPDLGADRAVMSGLTFAARAGVVFGPGGFFCVELE